MKKKIAIIFGGKSSEYGVSLQSASAVIANINTDKYDPILIGITEQGKWYRYNGQIQKIADDTWSIDKHTVPAVISPDCGTRGLLEFHADGIRITPVDAILPILHGKNGEDGTIQGLAQLAGIPLIGCDILASALCMDKHRAHIVAEAHGVKVPKGVVFHKDYSDGNIRQNITHLEYPLFVKPLKAGSSFGITKVYEPDQLTKAVENAFQYDDQVIVEEEIKGFEVGCAVLGNKQLIIGEVDEIELSDGFFDFKEKYTLETSSIHLPARIESLLASKVKCEAMTIYRALGCSGFARVDMFITPEQEIVFNEVNTIPGFTSHSRYPNMLKQTGLTFTEILDLIIETAFPENMDERSAVSA